MIDKPHVPQELSSHRDIALEVIKSYQVQRIEWYDKLKVKDLLNKDVTIFAARGCETAADYILEAFHAKESSSEETVMGTSWQNILAKISDDTIDTGDLTTVRDGVVWVLELKSQTNTTNSASFVQELRGLRTRKEEIESRRRASGQPVKVAMCIARDKKSRDEIRVYSPSDIQRENRDIAGFEYRYITGTKFWQWLAGYDSEIGLLMPISEIDGTAVRMARDRCHVRLVNELFKMLEERGLGQSIDDLVLLRDRLS
ncbi:MULTISPECIES: PmeII family type II restriction endonuclease [Brevibacterium]|uniref:PmeII family type II restriction endonuclease n=1 Tax=Brevibacterium TaxID=1696 RepID=UPI000F653FA7|nr:MULTISPECIES: PmeII family type II restriction endonuclease [Brevibacterium]AZL08018.1 hypothetical protein CXR26_01280 [Brevibacterium aurantiacum]